MCIISSYLHCVMTMYNSEFIYRVLVRFVCTDYK